MVAVEAAARPSRRYALLMAARDSEYVLKKYGGYLPVFVAAFGGAGEAWDLYRAIDGELPAPGDLGGYDGFVISGSPHDAYGDEPWILRLCVLVRELHAISKRVLGVCFGHQVICRALGGRVARARGGWDVGVREVAIADAPCRFLDALRERGQLPRRAKITEVHQDEVWEVPEGAEVLASSDKTTVEVFRVGEHVLGIQGHPEYTKDILLSLVDRLLAAGSITASFAEAVRRQLEASAPDREFWLKLCKSFLKADEDQICK
ncbi:putative glutamine amidotransferase-like protein C13C5.04 [Panicum miliaceum]|uniref:Glutamine amidotransferase-like protein C13C5.04 n=1 Tax=Panicum miliaceum TaxID=4540 RepID=A0A3L6T9Q5_PANMI|nr:putative glutamine amidotransferase-like protein C13C5.04 [Panicum miliaceum]